MSHVKLNKCSRSKHNVDHTGLEDPDIVNPCSKLQVHAQSVQVAQYKHNGSP